MDKEQLAIARLQDAARLSEHRYKKPLMVTYSGGKDSQVLVALAERAGISRSSLWKVESGSPAVAIGIYAAVLHALGGMDKDMLLVAKDDEMGRQMQDLNLLTKKRATRRKK